MKRSLINRKLGKVERALDKAIGAAEMPGAVVLTRMPREDELLEYSWTRGLSVVRPERIPMHADTIFDLASLTKNIATTTAIMLLVNDGVIALDDPVAKHLPAFAERDKGEVTVRHLLTHSAGLKPWRGFHELMIQKERKTGERQIGTAEGRAWLIDRVVRGALVHEVGEAAVYGDLDFIVLGALVEEVTGEPFERFCERRIFEPFGMKDTRFFPLAGSSGADGGDDAVLTEPLKRRIAATENCPWRDRIIWGEVHDPNAFAMGGVAGHAGLFGTAPDVMRFAQVFLDAWHGRSDLLPTELVREFARRQDMPEGSDWALGWDTPTKGASSSGQHFGENSVGHLGFTGTSVWIDLEREAIVVMLTNRVHLVAKKSKFTLRPMIHDFIIEGLTAGMETEPTDGPATQPTKESAAAATEATTDEPADVDSTDATSVAAEQPQGEAPSGDALRHVHFIAIGGTGMGSLAGLVKARGIEVTGSDKKLYPPMSTALADWGIPVTEGFTPEHVLERKPDLVVIGNAVRRDNPEAQAAIDAGLPYRSFSDALYELAMSHRHSVTVTGTHGKTTTTALASYLLLATGQDPSLLVGGISLDFGGSFREGQGDHFVVEGDEYDTAFFDKTPKFLHYHPKTLIVTSVEFDHADIYRDLDHVKSMFRKLVADMPADGTIIAAWDHAGVRDVVSEAPCRVVRYGLEHKGAEWRASAIEADGAATKFSLDSPDAGSTEVTLPMHGHFNVENALAAIATCASLGVSLPDLVAALPDFKGVKRRQEVRGEPGGVTVLDDFAHHPTAVAGTIEAVKARYAGRRVIAVFEPRSNTSRRKIFQTQYAEALSNADRVVVLDVPDEPIYSATGEVTELFSAAELVADLTERGTHAAHFADADAITESLLADRQDRDVLLVMSNGAFDGLFDKLLPALEQAAGQA